jgi:DNA-binding transcriptional LysR family regulator
MDVAQHRNTSSHRIGEMRERRWNEGGALRIVVSDQPSRGEIDFLVLPKNFIREGHPAEVLFEDAYVCVCWNGNPLIGDEISLGQCLQIGHVVARIGTLRPPTIDAWFFERFGHARRVEVIATNFNSFPHLLVGTNRISIMHRRLALAYGKSLPLKILPSPVTMPPLVEMIQWHKYRDRAG